ncbi:MAG: dipicolinate synthase subunit B [Oscillospiraceae bacterium]|nr:dipicolinate synthase subunit B [Oscillospiraceae bacterium]
MANITAGFALCGSFCTFDKIFPVMERLASAGVRLIPIMSYNAYSTDTRFGRAEDIIKEVEGICGEKIIHTLTGAEPIGPKKLLDMLIIAPCTGNTLAKIAAGIADTPVTLAVKSHLRNLRPVLIGISTNDALSAAAKNIGALQNRKNIYFIPYGQDDSAGKPNSMTARFDLTEDAVNAAIEGRQMQPIIIGSL